MSVPLQVFFELDLTSPRTLSQLSQCQLLPPGQHISEVIPTDLYLRLRMHLDYVRRAMPGWLTRDQLDSGLLAEYLFPTLTGRLVESYLNRVFFRKLFCFILLSANWERKLPIWIVLMVNSLTKSDIASRGFPVLDLHLSQLATRKRKVVGAIEEVGRLIFIISHDLYFSFNFILRLITFRQKYPYHQSRVYPKLCRFSDALQG